MTKRLNCFLFLISTFYLNNVNNLLAVSIDETPQENLLKQDQEERLSGRNLYSKGAEENGNGKDHVEEMLVNSLAHDEINKPKADSGSPEHYDDKEDGIAPDLTNTMNDDTAQTEQQKSKTVMEEEESSHGSPSSENLMKGTTGDTIDESSENADGVASNSDKIATNDEDFRQDTKTDAEGDSVGLKKHRHFSLLYTFGTLFNSFLSEFGDVSGHHDGGYNNSSEKEMKNSSVLDEVLSDTNSTSNNTESGKKTRFQCALRNVTENTIFEVKIVNSTELLEILNFSKNQKLSPCVLVMFYAPWCYFCAKTAPHYNALARAFPQLNILAVDTSHFSYLNARFGTVAVPNVMLFHSRSAVRFNHTTRDLDHFIQFVTNNTGLESNKSVLVESFDYEGPLSSQVVQKRDWLLWAAWAFVIVCSAYFFVGSLYGQAFIARIRVLWQEHQHIE